MAQSSFLSAKLGNKLFLWNVPSSNGSRNYTLIAINVINYLFPVQWLQRQLLCLKSIMQTTWNIYLSGCTLQRAWFNQTLLPLSLKSGTWVVSFFHRNLSSFKATDYKLSTLAIKHICSLVLHDTANHMQIWERDLLGIRTMTVPRDNTKLPKNKLKIKRRGRTKTPPHSEVICTSRFHFNQKTLFSFLLFCSTHISLVRVFCLQLILILQITLD